jgi:trigger factor
MKFSSKRLDTDEMEIIISASKEAFAKYLEKAFKKNVAEVEADGFRKGKMPKEIFIKKYGVERLYPDAIDALLNEQYKILLDKEGIDPIAPINFDYEKMEADSEKGFKITGKVPVMPKIVLPDYRAIASGIKMDKVLVEPSEIDKRIDEILEQQAMVAVKNGKIANGDTAKIDFEGFLDGKPFDGGKGESYDLVIGSNSFIPGFEEKLIGAGAGDDIDVDVSFPKDYHAENLAGKAVVFKCHIHEVSEKIKTVLTEENVGEIQGYSAKSIAELRTEIEKALCVEKEKQVKQK